LIGLWDLGEDFRDVGVGNTVGLASALSLGIWLNLLLGFFLGGRMLHFLWRLLWDDFYLVLFFLVFVFPQVANAIIVNFFLKLSQELFGGLSNVLDVTLLQILEVVLSKHK
jgi:ABC-type sugar transport system permease subunit